MHADNPIDGFLLQFNHVRNLRQPPRHQPMGLFNWMCDERPLSEDMSKFVYQIDDFISVAKSDNDAYASDMLESLLDSHPGVPFKVFASRDTSWNLVLT